MEWISHDGETAPRLAQTRPDRSCCAPTSSSCARRWPLMAQHGIVHGDLSAYNLLAAGERLVVIDLPQVLDLIGNPQGMDFLLRDCANVCAWFREQGTRPGSPTSTPCSATCWRRPSRAVASGRSRARPSRRTPPGPGARVDLGQRPSKAALPSPWKVCLRATGSSPRSWVSTASRHGIPASSAEASADAATAVMLSGPVTVCGSSARSRRRRQPSPRTPGSPRSRHLVQVEGDVGLDRQRTLRGQSCSRNRYAAPSGRGRGPVGVVHTSTSRWTPSKRRVAVTARCQASAATCGRPSRGRLPAPPPGRRAGASARPPRGSTSPRRGPRSLADPQEDLVDVLGPHPGQQVLGGRAVPDPGCPRHRLSPAAR